MPDRSLSKRQQKILDFIIEQIRAHGYGPTVREIVQHVGDKSPTSVHRHLRTLEARGYILREPNKSRSIRLAEGLRGLPLVGLIAAGSPIQAIEDVQRLDFCDGFDPNRHFVLKVSGDSMVDDNINDGDLIVVRSQSTCRDGDTVVALIDGDSATLKRFHRDNGRVRLQPANEQHDPIIIEEDRLQIQGVAVSVIRPVAASEYDQDD